MSADLIGTIANISLALSLIVGLVFGIGQVRAAARDRRERLTLETLTFFGSRDFAELIQYIDTHEMPKTRAGLRALPVKEQAMFIQFSMLMENLGILVAEKMINLDLVDETLGSFVVTTWAKLKPMAVSTRIEDNEPFMSEYFQWLAETIDARIKANPRPPAYERLPRRH
jgi:hypothetical protein